MWFSTDVIVFSGILNTAYKGLLSLQDVTSLPFVLSQTNGDKGIPAALIYSNYYIGGVQLLQHIYENSVHSINDLGGLISV